MRPLAELRWIAERVQAEIAANPSIRPYLGEDDPAPAGGVCPRGHPGSARGKHGNCKPCDAAGAARRRAQQREIATDDALVGEVRRRAWGDRMGGY